MAGMSVRLWNAAHVRRERTASYDERSTFWREKQDAVKDAALDVVEVIHFCGKEFVLYSSCYTAE